MALPILYSFRRCPYAIRARMALHKAGIAWEHREVSLKNKPAQMLAVSGKGTVPVLCQPDGTMMDESFDIMNWALQQRDPDNWLQVDMARLMPLIEQNDHGFKASLDRYKYHVRYPQFSQLDYRQQGEQFLKSLEQLLVQSGAGLLASRITLADVAIFPFIRQFAGVDRDWFDGSDYQHLVQWLRLMETSEDFLAVMQKHDLWN
jgi:glutathione S-transferase